MSIKRYKCDPLYYPGGGAGPSMRESKDGAYVLHSAHAAEMGRVRAELDFADERIGKLLARVSYYENALCLGNPLALQGGATTAVIEPERVGEVLDERDDLRARLARQEARVAELEDVLRGLEWYASEPGSTGAWGPACPRCGGSKYTGHYVNCALKSALTEAAP